MAAVGMAELVFLLVIVLLGAWALFWVIRLAVRYGVDDALRMQERRPLDRGGVNTPVDEARR